MIMDDMTEEQLEKWIEDYRLKTTGRVIRDCLHCGRKFKANGRFVRICNPCKNSQKFYDLSHLECPVDSN